MDPARPDQFERVLEQMTRASLPKHDEWLAAEYALGVLTGEQKKLAEKRYDGETDFRAAVDGWHNQLEPMLEEVDEVTPPPAVWKAIEAEIGISAQAAYAASGKEGLWKWVAGFASAVAVASVAMLFSVTEGDIFGTSVSELRSQIAQSGDEIETLSGKLEAAQDRLTVTSEQLDVAKREVAQARSDNESSTGRVASLEQQLSQAEERLAAAQRENEESLERLAEIERDIDASVPLVASLTSEGEVPAFVAQYDPLSRSLLIRTSAEDQDEKVPEIWFIPGKGARKGEALSLGVMDESAPNRLQVREEYVPWMDEGGTLAITMEPEGGSPTGSATGPIIAVGKLQALQ